MGKHKENKRKEKNLRQAGLKLILTLLLALIGYVLLQNESPVSNNTSSVNTQINTTNQTNTNIGIDDIPQYTGQISININNDLPYFKDEEITTEDFEYYSPLDELNRAGVGFANIGKYTMPKERNQKRKYFI